MFQLLMILISRGDVTFLANLYAFGVIWSFVLTVLRSSSCGIHTPEGGNSAYHLISQSPQEIPVGVGLITLTLLTTAVVNLFTNRRPLSRALFSQVHYSFFYSLRVEDPAAAGEKCVELDQFNLAQEAELTQDNLDVRPGNILVPISTNYALYALEAALRRAKRREAEVVVLHVQFCSAQVPVKVT